MTLYKKTAIYIICYIISIILHMCVITGLLEHLFLKQFNLLFIFILAYVMYFSYNILKKTVTKLEINIALGTYICVIFIALYLKGYFVNEVILNPLSFFNFKKITLMQSVLNTLLMFPMGIYFKYYQIKIYYSIVLFFILEGFQYIFKVGTFDVGDVVLYLLGFSLGVIIFRVYNYIK